MRLQKSHDLEKRVRLDQVIVIEKRDPFAASARQCSIRSRGNTFVFRRPIEDDTLVAGSQGRQCIY